MLGRLGQPVIFLPLLSLCSHQKESYKQQKLILLWILLWAATSQAISLLYVSLEPSWGKSYTRRELLCALSCMRKAGLNENCSLSWCRQVYERLHYYFSDYIGVLEMYLFFSLKWLVFTFSSSENNTFLLT